MLDVSAATRNCPLAANRSFVAVNTQRRGFTATWIVAGLADPAFSFVNNDTSDLGALTAAPRRRTTSACRSRDS